MMDTKLASDGLYMRAIGVIQGARNRDNTTIIFHIYIIFKMIRKLGDLEQLAVVDEHLTIDESRI